MMHLSCDRFTDLVLEVRHADPETRRAMDQHMQQCAACRQVHQQMQEVAAMFTDTDHVEPPEGFADRVMAAVTTGHPVEGDTAIPVLTAVLAVLLALAYAAQHGVIRLWTDVSSAVAAVCRDWLPALKNALDAPVGMVTGIGQRLLAAQAGIDWLLVAAAVGIVLAFGLGSVYEMSRKDPDRVFYH